MQYQHPGLFARNDEPRGEAWRIGLAAVQNISRYKAAASVRRRKGNLAA